jgi:hypothetical protein
MCVIAGNPSSHPVPGPRRCPGSWYDRLATVRIPGRPAGSGEPLRARRGSWPAATTERRQASSSSRGIEGPGPATSVAAAAWWSRP